MTNSAVIPASFVLRAKRHLERTGQPLLFGPRRRSDVALLVDGNRSSARWAVLLDPRSVPALLDELAEAVQDRDAPETPRFTDLMLRFSAYAAVAVRGLPTELTDEDGEPIGHISASDNCLVFASSALALSCLSWVLRYHEPRPGFFLVNESS